MCALKEAQNMLAAGEGKAMLPVGVGLIMCHATSHETFGDALLSVLASFRVSSLWLFAPPEGSPVHRGFIDRARKTGGEWGEKVRVWVQVGTVAAAREAVRDGADVVVAQGVDAGGHQFASGSGVVALTPEVVDAVAEESQRLRMQVAVVAAGGISDGRGVAAALCLGAQGAVMGTRVGWPTFFALAFPPQKKNYTDCPGLSSSSPQSQAHPIGRRNAWSELGMEEFPRSSTRLYLGEINRDSQFNACLDLNSMIIFSTTRSGQASMMGELS